MLASFAYPLEDGGGENTSRLCPLALDWRLAGATLRSCGPKCEPPTPLPQGPKAPIPTPQGPPSPTAGEIVVATTRVETMLGDTAVAVHPEDPR